MPVRKKIGPVAAFKVVGIATHLPKTRSGKVLRAIMRNIADSEPYTVPATIDELLILDEVEQSLKALGYAGA